MKTLSNSKRANPTILTGTHHSIVYPHMRRAIGLGGTIVALVIIVLAVVLIFTYVPPKGGVSLSCGLPGQPACTPGITSSATVQAGNVPGLIKFVITNPFSGSSASPTSFKVYPASGSVVGGQTYGGLTASETITISSGAGTSALFYSPGTVLNVYELLSGSNTIYYKVTAPGVTPAMQAQGTAAQVAMYDPTNPTLTLTMVDNKGNAITSGTTIENFTNSGHCPTNTNCLGQTSTTFTLTITNTAANTGWFSSYDPINAQNWCLAVQGKEAGTNVNLVSVTGFPTSAGAFTIGSTRYWQSNLPDGFNPSAQQIIQAGFFNNAFCTSYSTASGGISEQTQGQANVGGTITLVFTVSQGNLATGNSMNIAFQVYQYYDPVYATNNAASGGSTAATLGSAFTLKIAR